MDKYIQILKKYKIKNSRIDHSISTANFMKKHAKYFHINEEKAYIAGLLHDIAKELPDNEVVKLAKSFIKRNIYKIKYFNFKKDNPGLLHGAASAELLLTKNDIRDPEILEAVCQHTTGGIGLKKLSKYAFFADYCEPNRKYPNSRKVYQIVVNEKDFDKAYFYSYYYLIKRLVYENKKICPESLYGYNEAYDSINLKLIKQDLFS